MTGEENNCGHLIRMYDRFEGCDHLVDELYDYALANKVTPALVDEAINQAYLKRTVAYHSLDRRGGQDFEDKLRKLNVEVLSEARSELSDFVHGKTRFR